MSTKKKMLQAAAGSAGGGAGGLDVDDVFSTYLYTGNGHSSSNVIANGIDLSGEGGLVWIKGRNTALNHIWVDTVRGVTKTISSNNDSGQLTDADTLTTFNSDGFRLGADTKVNRDAKTFASWTWRKAPKYFDIVTYTGSGSAKTVAHSLDSVPGMIIVKNLSVGDEWAVYHRANTAAPETEYLKLDTDAATADSAAFWNDTAPTSSVFTVGTNHSVNANNENYVAYLFAHHDGDGEFGPTGDQDIIKCGSFTMGSTTLSVDLGFEPQWLMVKSTSSTNQWRMVDNMRGWNTDSDVGTTKYQKMLYANLNNAEGDASMLYLNSTGFTADSTGTGDFIYMAIRRGSLFPPEDATKVFAAAYGNSSGEPAFTSNFPVDFGIWHGPTSGNENKASTRLTQGRTLNMDDTSAEASSTAWAFDYQDGFMSSGGGSSNFATMWKRAPSFCDVVCYKGVSGSQTINHSLGVAPDLIFVKNRSDAVSWSIYHSAVGKDKRLILGGTSGSFYAVDTDQWQNTAPTSTAFYVNGDNNMSGTGDNLIAYLFATLAGVSKLGGYTGNGSSQTIDCGFASGSRFILVKRTDSAAGNNAGDWFIWDSVRGIASGNDPHLSLNTDAAEVTGDDSIDPASSGFIVNQVSATNINVSSATYVYYAIA